VSIVLPISEGTPMLTRIS